MQKKITALINFSVFSTVVYLNDRIKHNKC